MASLIYPALLITLVCGLFIFLITFVVPQFAKLYDQIGTKLPAMTLACWRRENQLRRGWIIDFDKARLQM